MIIAVTRGFGAVVLMIVLTLMELMFHFAAAIPANDRDTRTLLVYLEPFGSRLRHAHGVPLACCLSGLGLFGAAIAAISSSKKVLGLYLVAIFLVICREDFPSVYSSTQLSYSVFLFTNNPEVPFIFRPNRILASFAIISASSIITYLIINYKAEMGGSTEISSREQRRHIVSPEVMESVKLDYLRCKLPKGSNNRLAGSLLFILACFQLLGIALVIVQDTIASGTAPMSIRPSVPLREQSTSGVLMGTLSGGIFLLLGALCAVCFDSWKGRISGIVLIMVCAIREIIKYDLFSDSLGHSGISVGVIGMIVGTGTSLIILGQKMIGTKNGT